MLLGSDKVPESKWDCLEELHPQSEWLSCRDFLIKGGSDLRRTPVKVKKLQTCMQLLVTLDEEVREFVMDQLHPSVRSLAVIAHKLVSSDVPWSLARLLVLELSCLKFKGTAAMAEMAQDWASNGCPAPPPPRPTLGHGPSIAQIGCKLRDQSECVSDWMTQAMIRCTALLFTHPPALLISQTTSLCG